MASLSELTYSASLFDHTSGASLPPPVTAASAIRSQWLTRDAAARLAVRNHLPLAELAHFGQYKTAQALYDAVVARYSSPATAAHGRLILTYLFPELDHFLALDPTDLNVNLLEKHLLAAETSIVAVGAARGTPRTTFFEGCSPSPLAPSYAFVAAIDILGAENNRAASALSGKRRIGKGKGGKSGGGGSGGGGGVGNGGVGGGGGCGSAGSGGRSGGFGGGGGGTTGGGGGSGDSSGSGGGGSGGGRGGAVQRRGSSGGQRQQPRGQRETPTPQQLHEWFAQRGASGGSVCCPYVIRTGDRAGQTCGKLHTQHRCFSRLDDAWRAEFGDEAERPRWAELLRSGVDIFALDYDAILAAMYTLSLSAKGDCYLCLPPDPGIEAAALSASESSLPGTAPAEALHTFTLDSACVDLHVYADGPSPGHVHPSAYCYWSVPPDPGIATAALGASASGTPPGTARVAALHTFTLDSGASRCFFRDSTTLTPLPAPIPVRLADPSGGPVVASSSTVLPCPAVPSGSLSGLHLPSFSTNLVSTAALQDVMVTTTTPRGSSLYTLATVPPQVAASAQVSASGQVAASCSCRLLSHQTLLWHHRLGHPSLPGLRGMHSRLLLYGLPRSLPPLPPSPAPPCLPCVEGRQRAAPHSSSFPSTTAPLQTLHTDVWGPAHVSGQGRERYFLLVVGDYTRYTAVFPLRSKGEVSAVLIPWIRTFRLQLRERIGQDLPVLRLQSDRGGEFSSSLLRDICRGEGILQLFTLPNSPQQDGIAERRIGLVMEVARTSMIHAAAPHFLWPLAVRFSCLVRDTSADKLSAHAIPCVFLGFVPDAPGWQFYHPTSRRVLPSQDVTFDELVPFYRLFPYRSAPSPPPPLFLAPGPPPVDPLPPQGPAPLGVSQVDPLPCTGRVQGAGSGGAELEGVEPGGAESEGAEPGGAESEGVESGGAEPRGAALSGGPAGASPRLSSQQQREWFVQHPHGRSGAPGAGEPGDAGAGGAAVTTGAGDPTEPGAGVAGVGGPGAGGAGAAGAGAVDPRAGGAGGTVRPFPYFVPLLQQVLGVPSSTSLPPPFLCPPPDQSQPRLQPASPLPVPSPYTEQYGGLTEQRELALRPFSLVRTARCAPRLRPPPIPGAHTMALRPSSVPLHVPLPAPPESSLPEVPDLESDGACAASPTVARLLATAFTDPSFESAAVSALVAELLDFAAACRLDYASALVAESVLASPPSVGGECALGTDVLEDRQEEFECLAAAVPRFASLLLAPEGDPDAPDIPTPRSYAEAITGTYVDEVPPPGANIVDGMWIFRVKRPPGSPPAFKARYVAQGFSQRQGVSYFQTFSPTPKMTTLWVLLHVAAQCDYELHSLDFNTAFLQGSLHEEMWLRRPPGFTGPFPTGTHWCLRQPVYGLREAPREWHDTLRTTLAALGFVPSTADPSLFLRTDTSLPPFYVLVYVLQRFGFHTLGMGLVLGGRGPVVLTGYADASWVDDSATQRSSQGYTFSLGSGSLTYLLTDLGEQPRSPPVLYVDNKAMIALCQEHRLEHRTKHIALRYFLARDLQQRGQLRLAYVAFRTNTADVFTKALPPGDHQRFVTVLGLVPTLPHLLTA
ncbi:unnamed protein product [Closterium sp. NIES-53]